MKNYGCIYGFLRDKDLIHRRTKINEIGFQMRDRPCSYRFSIKEVTGILNRAGISVCAETVRVWCKSGLLPAFKVSKKRYAKWWVMKCHIRELQRRMHMMSEALEEYRETVKRERRERPRYVVQDRELPDRDRDGRFIKKTENAYDHSPMVGRLD